MLFDYLIGGGVLAVVAAGIVTASVACLVTGTIVIATGDQRELSESIKSLFTKKTQNS